MSAPVIDKKVANQVVVVYFFQWNRPCIDKFGIVDLANMLCGRSEDAYRTLKSEYAGGMFPSGYFGANGCWLMLACLSTNVVALARRVTKIPTIFRRSPIIYVSISDMSV